MQREKEKKKIFFSKGWERKRKRNLKIVYLRVKAIVAEVLRVWHWKNWGLVGHCVKSMNFDGEEKD